VTPEVAVIQRLQAIPAVTSMVGNRIYLAKLPQSPVLPAIRVQVIDETRTGHLRGGKGPARTRVQVDAVVAEASGTDPYTRASTLTEAIIGNGSGSALSGWRGTIGTLDIRGILQVDRAVEYDGTDREVRARMDFFVLWK
jgi:Protein of unknown function (DUF3168)